MVNPYKPPAAIVRSVRKRRPLLPTILCTVGMLLLILLFAIPSNDYSTKSLLPICFTSLLVGAFDARCRITSLSGLMGLILYIVLALG